MQSASNVGAAVSEDRAPSQTQIESDTSAPAQRIGRPLTIGKDGDGLLFLDRGGGLSGAVRHEGVTYAAVGTRRESGNGKLFWDIEGRSSTGGVVSGRLFREQGGSTADGRALPGASGSLRTESEHVVLRMAGWAREKGSRRFFSMKLTPRPMQVETLPLPFDLPSAT